MKKLLLTTSLMSVLALSGCDSYLNRDKPVEEPTEEVIKNDPIVEEQPVVDVKDPAVETPVVETTEEVVPEQTIETVEVTANQLGRDYAIDSFRADKLYKDKALTVTGSIENIFISSSSDKAIVFLTTGDVNIPVMASGDASFATRVKDLKVKAPVKLLCEGTEAVSKAPQIRKCTVI